jgi:uncharacterized delta-60 repeat protein
VENQVRLPLTWRGCVLVIVLILAAVGCGRSGVEWPAIGVVSPGGGQIWLIGSLQAIAWTSFGVEAVRIELSRDGGRTWETIGLRADAGAYGSCVWRVTGPASPNCVIRVSDASSAVIADISRRFTITPPAITVTSPNGGETWYHRGPDRAITWVSVGVSYTVDILYSTDTGATWKTIALDTPNTGHYTWTIPDEDSSQCIVMVRETGRAGVSDISDLPFTIAPATITVTAPNGGEVWDPGTDRKVTWTTSGINKMFVDVHFSTDSGASWTAIALNTPDDGAFVWSVPNEDSAQCLVRVQRSGYAGPSDCSDAPFTITPPKIIVTSPNGGETWDAGTVQTVTWVSFVVETVRIDLSRDGGMGWENIVTSTPASVGSYSWTLEGRASMNCLVRVSNAAYGVPADKSDAPFEIEWLMRTWGGSKHDDIDGVVVDLNGNIYCAGHTYSFGAGDEDALVLKYDFLGNLQWARTYDYLEGIAVDASGNLYCAGYTYGLGSGGYDATTLKYDRFGTLQWAKTYGGVTHDFFTSIAIDTSDNIYCAGCTSSFGAGSYDALVVKYDSSGSLQWARTYGGSGYDSLNCIAVDTTGNVYCVGSTESFGLQYADGLILRYNSSGMLEWAKTWGGDGSDCLNGVAVDSKGNICCAGHCDSFGAGDCDAVIIKYDSSGTLEWAKTYGGSSADYANGVAFDSTGDIYCAGYTCSFSAEIGDGLVLKFDESGILYWAKVWAAGYYDRLLCITIDSTDRVLLGGCVGAGYACAWRTITTGIESSQSGIEDSPGGSESSPVGKEGTPSGRQTSPVGSETGGGASDTLLLKLR